ncbi:hypothetical protein A5721_27680 [Mycobacterium vulneris]|nr:hypothetical protein A5721_27680 [Mycolicibacterium vulneris]
MCYDLTFIDCTRAKVFIAIKFFQEGCPEYKQSAMEYARRYVLIGLDDEKAVTAIGIHAIKLSLRIDMWARDSRGPVTDQAFD